MLWMPSKLSQRWFVAGCIIAVTTQIAILLGTHSIAYATNQQLFLTPPDVETEALLRSIQVGGVTLVAEEWLDVVNNSVPDKRKIREMWSEGREFVGTDGEGQKFEDDRVLMRVIEGGHKRPTIDLGIKTPYGLDIYRLRAQQKTNPKRNPIASAFKTRTLWELGTHTLHLQSQRTEFSTDAGANRFIDTVVAHQQVPQDAALLAIEDGADVSLRDILEEENLLTPNHLIDLIGATAKSRHQLSSDLLVMIADLADVPNIESLVYEAVHGASDNDFESAKSARAINGPLAQIIAAHAFLEHGYRVTGFLKKVPMIEDSRKRGATAHVGLHFDGQDIFMQVKRIVGGARPGIFQDFQKKVGVWSPEAYKIVALVHEKPSYSINTGSAYDFLQKHNRTSIVGVSAKTADISHIRTTQDRFTLTDQLRDNIGVTRREYKRKRAQERGFTHN